MFFVGFQVLLCFTCAGISAVENEFQTSAKEVVLIDDLTQKVMLSKNADRRMFPASMSKVMTLFIAFERLVDGTLSLDDEFLVSEKAWRMGGSKMFVEVGKQVSVEDLLRGIIVQSGNDACIALAEGIAGTEEEFAIMMTSKAKEIGMTNTNFTNSSGINAPDNLSTVRDILIMSDYLIKNFPEYYKYFKEKKFTWDRTGGDPITQGNRNPLLYKNMGVDGIKTGYLAYEKYSLAASMKRNDRRLIAIGSGYKTKSSRSKETAKLLTYGITNFDTIKIATKDENLESLDVWLGKKDKVNVHTNTDIYKTVPKARKKYLKAIINYQGPILAPIKKGDIVAKLNLFYKDELINNYDLYSNEDIKKVNIFSRIIKSLNYLVWGDV